MYRLLFVDDEPIVWPELERNIEWERLRIQPSVCYNSLEACEAILEAPPDIVITDIRMPQIDGLTLVEKVSAVIPGSRFIILSGYDDFDYAQRAMKYGVRHYLLKPAGRQAITNALRELIGEIEKKQQQEQKQLETEQMLLRIAPQLKEHILRDCLFRASCTSPEDEMLREKLELNEPYYSFALFELDTASTLSSAFLLKEATKELFGTVPFLKDSRTFLVSVIGSSVLIMVSASEYDSLTAFIHLVQDDFKDRSGLTFTAALVEKAAFTDLNKVYHQLKQYAQYRLYLGGGGVITPNELLGKPMDDASTFSEEYEQIALAAVSGNVEKAEEQLETCFKRWNNEKLPFRAAKLHCIELVSRMFVKSGSDSQGAHVLVKLISDSSNSLETIFETTRNMVLDYAREQYHATKNKTHELVKQILDYVYQNYPNENLSISWIAGNVVYLNADYVGRLFKKETGWSLNAYICHLRIDHAKELFRQNPDYSNVEVAQKVGLCKNPQYFVKLFKQSVGMTPRMYKLQYKNISGTSKP